MTQFKTIQDVWAALDQNETIYWHNKSYKVFIEQDLSPDITASYGPRYRISRNGQLLTIRCIENYFGSILHENEISSLFTEKVGT